jgi:uncharacterized NAD-dependent epimerase/dehydratase family protein
MITEAPFVIRGRRALLLASGAFSALWAKTAACFLMYRPDDAVAVVDADQAGRTAGEVLGFGGEVPVVDSVEAGLAFGPEIAVVGTAPMGGVLDAALRKEVLRCLESGVDVVSGLHVFLDEDPDARAAMERSGARVWDVRRILYPFAVSRGKGCTTGARTVLVVGSDCNVGKMTVALELSRAACRRGIRSGWAATGQTGMLLRERGVCVDRVISDFVGGAAQELVNAEGRDVELLFVEGQGAVVHPGYAAVTLGLMYGVMPDCMVMAHVAGRDKLKRLETPILPLAELIDLHERLLAPFKPSPVAGVTLNTAGLDADGARRALDAATKRTGLPACDVVRFDGDPVLDAVLNRIGLS